MSKSKSFRDRFRHLSIEAAPLLKLSRTAKRLRVGGKTIVFTLIILLIAVTGIAVYLSQIPSTQPISVKVYNYKHVADYRYIADLKPNILYNTTTLPQGEPIYLPLVRSLRVVLDYNVSGANIKSGKAVLMVKLVDPGRWDKIIHNETLHFTSGFEWSYEVNVTEISKLASLIRKEIGISTSKYDIVFSAIIKSSVDADGHFRTDTITPSLVFTIDHGASRITVKEEDEVLPFEESQTSYSSVYLKLFPLGILGQDFEVSELKLYIYTAVPIITALTIVAWGTMWPRALEKSEIDILEEKYGDLMIDLAAPPNIGEAIVDVRSMDDLARISTSLGKPILHYSVDGKHYYVVLDDGSAYRYGAGNSST